MVGQKGKRNLEPLIPVVLEGVKAVGIFSEGGHEGDVSAGPVGSQGLVGALATHGLLKHPAGEGFPGCRKMIHSSNQIGVGTPDHKNIFHNLVYYVVNSV